MPKAKSIDRLELTRRKMAFREAMKHAHEVPAFPGAEEHLEDEANICPVCGGEVIRWEGCYRCKNCGWSKC